eukprot:scaffold238325_cov24-Tisochrysis_lutea.AAC.1
MRPRIWPTNTILESLLNIATIVVELLSPGLPCLVASVSAASVEHMCCRQTSTEQMCCRQTDATKCFAPPFVSTEHLADMEQPQSRLTVTRASCSLEQPQSRLAVAERTCNHRAGLQAQNSHRAATEQACSR